jgi:heat shock protein HtpX
MMWELIRSNQRKSFFLLFGMASCLLALGYVIGMAVDPVMGGIYGVLTALAVFAVMFLVSYFGGDSILLGVSKALEISPDVHPQLFNVVEEMKIASGLPSMPKVYLIPDPAFNAFATGVRADKSAVAVTAGLLGALNRDELQGVVAHEMSHIQNRDVLYMTFAGIMLGSMQLISEMFLRGWTRSSYSARSRSRSSSSGGGQAQLAFILIAILFAILAPVLAQLFYFSLSRKREYLADASAVRLTRYPEGLASALEKISFKNTIPNVSKVASAMFIENPLREPALSLGSLTSTHPPIQDRIRILRKMSGAGRSQRKSFPARA